MEDLRKTENAFKKDKKSGIDMMSIITGIFIYIRVKYKILLFWVLVIFLINIVVNPNNTAHFISTWYNNFVVTLIENIK